MPVKTRPEEKVELGTLRKRCPTCKATRFLREPIGEVDSDGNWHEVGEAEYRCVGCRELWASYTDLDDYRQAEKGIDLSQAEAYDAMLVEEARLAREANKPVVDYSKL